MRITHTDVMNIETLIKRANSEGIRVSRYLVKQAIEAGDLEARLVARTYLIRWDRFLSWVLCESIEGKKVSSGKYKKH